MVLDYAALLLAVTGGFIFSSNWTVTQFLIARASGYGLFFLSILSAYVLFQITCLLIYPLVLEGWSLHGFISLWLHPIDSHLPAAIHRDFFGSVTYWDSDLLVPSVLTLILGAIVWIPANWAIKLWPTKEAILISQIKRNGTELDQMFLQALAHKLQLLITLRTGKAYVGAPVKLPRLGHPDDRRNDGYTLLVFRSGYRDPTTQKVFFTTNYEWIYDDQVPAPAVPISLGELETFVTAREIVAVTFFDPSLYDDFQIHGAMDTPSAPSVKRLRRSYPMRQ